MLPAPGADEAHEEYCTPWASASAPGVADQVDRLLGRHFIEPLAAALQGFLKADGRLLHALVRLLRAADEEEVVALRNAPVAVAVQADAEEADHPGGLRP